MKRVQSPHVARRPLCRPRSCGQASIELVMSFLLFIAMLGTLLSLSLYMYMQHVLLTGAKEGARYASVEANLAGSGGTYTTGVANVKNWVKNFVQSTSSVSLADSNIAVLGPTGTVGSRTVRVNVTYTFQNPVRIREFMARLSGGSGSGLDNFTMASSATMRYEE